MTLSTAGADGSTTARTLILEDVGPGGRRFASAGGSVKARDLGERSYAALTFYWPRLARQVRVCGPVVAESAEAGAVDFRARRRGPGGVPGGAPVAAARGSRGARRGRQGVTGPPGGGAGPGGAGLDAALGPARVRRVLAGRDKERRHTRLAYPRDGSAWTKQLLWP
jgi:pyridoxamine 5'-phosphate oxidase